MRSARLFGFSTTNRAHRRLGGFPTGPAMIRAVVLLFASLSCLSPACLAEDAVKNPKYPRVIVGKVKDVEGKPIKGARVEYGYFSAKAADREFVLTDADGLYRLEMNQAGRDFRVGVSAIGYAPHYVDRIVPGPADRPTEHSVKLNPGAGRSRSASAATPSISRTASSR